jgi:hypothetical protein
MGALNLDVNQLTANDPCDGGNNRNEFLVG